MRYILSFSLVIVGVCLLAACTRLKTSEKNDMVKQIIIEGNSPAIKGGILQESVGIGITEDKLAPFISTGQNVPCKKSYTFSTTEDNQDQITLKFYRGKSESLKDDNFMGEFKITGFKIMPAGQPLVEVTIEVKENDIIIYAKDLKSNNVLNIEQVNHRKGSL